MVPRVLDKPIAMPPPMDPAVIGPMERLAAKYFPGVPVVPAMATGASDAVYTQPIPLVGGDQTTYNYQSGGSAITIVFKNDKMKEKSGTFNP